MAAAAAAAAVGEGEEAEGRATVNRQRLGDRARGSALVPNTKPWRPAGSQPPCVGVSAMPAAGQTANSSATLAKLTSSKPGAGLPGHALGCRAATLPAAYAIPASPAVLPGSPLLRCRALPRQECDSACISVAIQPASLLRFSLHLCCVKSPASLPPQYTFCTLQKTYVRFMPNRCCRGCWRLYLRRRPPAW